MAHNTVNVDGRKMVQNTTRHQLAALYSPARGSARGDNSIYPQLDSMAYVA